MWTTLDLTVISSAQSLTYTRCIQNGALTESSVIIPKKNHNLDSMVKFYDRQSKEEKSTKFFF